MDGRKTDKGESITAEEQAGLDRRIDMIEKHADEFGRSELGKLMLEQNPGLKIRIQKVVFEIGQLRRTLPVITVLTASGEKIYGGPAAVENFYSVIRNTRLYSRVKDTWGVWAKHNVEKISEALGRHVSMHYEADDAITEEEWLKLEHLKLAHFSAVSPQTVEELVRRLAELEGYIVSLRAGS